MNKSIAIFVKEVSFANQYFKQVLDGLSAHYDIYILHTNKLERGRGANCKYQDYDISNWSHFKVRKIIYELKLETLMITNIRSLLDVYLMSVCNSINLPITYIEHGVSLSKMSMFKLKSKKHSIQKYCNYIIKVLQFFLLENNRGRKIKNIYWAIIKSDYKYLILDKAIFYTQDGKEVLDRFFKFKNLKVEYSGYPIVGTERDLEVLKSKNQKKQVLYIHQPLIQDQFSDLSFREEAEIIKEIGNVCKSFGLVFIVKLHPRDCVDQYRKNLTGIQIAGFECSVHDLIAESKIILGHFSTALFTAIILRKELYILDNWRINVDAVSYFDSLKRTISTISELNDKLGITEKVDLKVYESFQVQKIGLNNTHESRVHKLKSIL